MTTVRKNKLLIAAAVAALTAGSGFALAQAPDSNPASKGNPAARSAPAEKTAPAAKQPGAGELKGAPKAGDKAASPNRMGQTNQGTKSKTETTGQASSPDAKNKTETKGQASSPSAKSKSETTGQAPMNQGSEKSKTETKSNSTAQTPASKDDKFDSRSGSSTTQKSGGTATTGSTSASATLNAEQKTKIHQVIISDRSAPRVASVNFQLNVGVAVPRSVRLARVPTSIIEIQPSWRGFEYFLVGDEIVIVDPRTMQIVAVIPA